MKQTIRKLALALAWVFGTAAVTDACAQETIIYVSGPSFPFQYGVDPAAASLDLNQDGAPDFSVQLGYFLCTADVPISGCSAPYYLTALGANSVLQRFNEAALLSFGDLIEDPPPAHATWSDPEQSATVADFFFSPRFNTRGVDGPLAQVGVGYLGVRFHAADGWHYGWVRLRIAPRVEVVDWAYEARPQMPIHAGRIGSNSESLQFMVLFRGQKNHVPAGAGSFILTGNNLRGEVTLAGAFSSAEIVRAKGKKAKPIASLGQPLARHADFTSFLDDATLSHAELVHLLRGADELRIDRGAILGQILPLK
jgi:hypothetical protein